jgi:UDP-N-acetylglucosamine 1-carboxyvinyltransferase
MGANIEGIGTHTLEIEGVEALHGTTHRVVADRIEAGTYLAAAGITGGDVEVVGIDPEILSSTLDVFEKMGIKIERKQNSVRAIGNGLKAVNVVTAPYPDFPTDMQAQVSALMCVAKG